jgi:AraC-like DNA-binding protein
VWLTVGGEERRLAAGDCFVIATDAPYAVASGPGMRPVDGLPLFRASTDGVARVGSAEEVAMTGGRFVLDESSAQLLLDVLPPLFVVAADGAAQSPLRATLDLFTRETSAPRPGSALVARHLGHVVFAEALRAALEQPVPQVRGWLAALADERIGRALHLMHSDPARRWTAPELAAAVHMSRSAFAGRFRELVGDPPLDFLLSLRMRIAGRALRTTTLTVSAVGAQLGYTSDAAFSTAFRRVMGVTPTAWRRRAPDAAAWHDETDAPSSRRPSVTARSAPA